MPSYICLHGRLLQTGRVVEPESLPHVPLPARPAPRDRWLELANLAVKPGWVVTQHFCIVLNIGAGNIVHGAARVNKRLRENGEDLENRKTGGRGPPLKMYRISTLQRAYRDLA